MAIQQEAKISLDIIANTKNIQVNGKTVKVPKLGLKHRLAIKPEMGPNECMTAIHKLVCPNLSVAERDIVTLHILEYNGKLKQKVIKDGFEYNLDDVKICQQLKFSYGEYEFKFKSATSEIYDGPLDMLLKSCCVYVKKNGAKIDVPDFMDMPAFVYKWAQKITDTVAIDGPKGEIKGMIKIMELFNE